MKHLCLMLIMCLSGCQTTTQTEKDALLLNPTIEVQQELTLAVSKIIGKPKVLLNAEDLTKNSILPVERIRLKDADGLRMQGLETEEPKYFKLVKKGEDCFLILLKTDKRELIKSAKCI
jgi:hypothetical protein